MKSTYKYTDGRVPDPVFARRKTVADLPKKVTIVAMDRLIKKIDTRYDAQGFEFGSTHIRIDRDYVRTFLDEHGVPHE